MELGLFLKIVSVLSYKKMRDEIINVNQECESVDNLFEND